MVDGVLIPRMLVVLIPLVAGVARGGPLPCGVGWGDCYSPNDTPGCEHGTCCSSVCGFDQFCCEAIWDQLCVDTANTLCPDTSCSEDLDGDGHVAGGDLGLLLGAWGSEGPGDLDGSGTVDGEDLGALLGAWGTCPSPCGTPGLDCFSFHFEPGCEDEACCDAVCELDPYCCFGDWDATCFYAAGSLCLGWGAGAGDCFEVNGTPACELLNCAADVCAVLPACCEVAWDAPCAAIALRSCSPCDIGAGDCYAPNGTPGCGGTESTEPQASFCCEKVCADDPFCCESEWDEVCVEAYIQICGVP